MQLELWHFIIVVVAQIGGMIWWASRTDAAIKSIKEDSRAFKEKFEEHVKEDRDMQNAIHALEVNEANVGGLLSNMNLKIDQINSNIRIRESEAAQTLQLKLDKQSNELILRFRDMLHSAKKEWGNKDD